MLPTLRDGQIVRLGTFLPRMPTERVGFLRPGIPVRELESGSANDLVSTGLPAFAGNDGEPASSGDLTWHGWTANVR